MLERLLRRRLIERATGLREEPLYRITIAGLQHPQFDRSADPAEPPRPPVESDRVRRVLSAIFEVGELRIKDVAKILELPRQSINALMQYLNRKGLVKKAGRKLHSPYALTAAGMATLAEMTRRHAA